MCDHHSNEFWFCSALEAPPVAATEATRVKGRAALLKSKHWGPHRRLSVGFIGGSDIVRKRVADIARMWSAVVAGGVTFDFWLGQNVAPGSADIRVSFVLNNRSWSYLGTDARNHPSEATMNLGWLTEDLSEDRARSVVLHEFGHALGLIHEHQNPYKAIDWNIPNVVADLSGPPNNWDPDTIKQNMFSRYEPGDLFATDVDPNSIMMYPIKPSWTNDGFSVGFNTDLSPYDIALVKAAYPKIGV
jgi:serralysin